MTTNIDLGLNRNLERISADLGSLGPVTLSQLSGEEALSTCFLYEGRARVPVSIAAGGSAAVRPERVAGDWATLVLRDAHGSERRVRGLVAEAEVELHELTGGVLGAAEATVRFVVRPAFHRLTLGRGCRAFLDQDVVDIAKDVFAKTGLEARFELRDSYKKRPYTVQYNESDFDFVSRLFEEEGIYYWFDHAAGSILVVADYSPNALELDDAGWQPGAPTGAELVYRPESGLVTSRAFVQEIGAHPRARAGKFSLASFDFQKPSFKVAAQATRAGGSGHEVYHAPGGGDEDPNVLNARAKKASERAEVEASNFRGVSPTVRLAPGRIFELSQHPFARMDGKYLVVSTSFAVDNVGVRGGESKPIEMSFSAIPSAIPFRPEPVTPAPKHPGLQTGVVVGPSGSEIHTDSHGRVRLQQHWDREGQKDEKSGRWVRVAQRGVAGSMMFPRMGWNVLSFGEEGSVDAPIAMSRTFDAEHPPPYALPENKTRVAYRTATTPMPSGGGGGGGGGSPYNELRFEDKKGSEEMFINSTGDMNVLVKDTKGEVIHGFMVHKIGVDHTLTVGGTYDVHVDKDQTVAVGASQSESVGTDREKLVNGNEAIKIGASRNLKTGVNVDTTGESRKLKVGGLHLSATLGEIKAQTKMFNQLVGGAVLKATPRAMSESVGSEVNVDTAVGYLPAKAQAAAGMLKKIPGVSGQLAKLKAKVGIAIQTIGVLKFETGKNRNIVSEGTYSERVLGKMTLTASADMTDTAKNTLKIDAGTLVVTTKTTMVIKSDTEVVLQCGDATTLTVNKEGVKLKSPEIQLSGSSGFAVAAAAKVDINP